jgi:adenosylhomocysteine nucleosidase
LPRGARCTAPEARRIDAGAPVSGTKAEIVDVASARPLAIASAMRQELRALWPLLQGAQTLRLAGREFLHGTIAGQPVVLVLSGIGKVAAATTAALLLQSFNARRIVFTGVAGGLGDGVRVGDIVVARQLVQHDMDASPLFPRFEVPLTGRSHFDADTALSDALAAAARRCLDRADALIGAPLLGAFGIRGARVHEGLVVSGDRFVSGARESAALRALLPQALAVEMEGAAVAQVCADFGRPFAVLRSISDRADDDAPGDFTRFIDEIASVYARAVVEDWLRHGHHE